MAVKRKSLDLAGVTPMAEAPPARSPCFGQYEDGVCSNKYCGEDYEPCKKSKAVDGKLQG